MKEDLRAFWRNEFASAALTGLLAKSTQGLPDDKRIVNHSRELADQLLLEMERNPIPPKEA